MEDHGSPVRPRAGVEDSHSLTQPRVEKRHPSPAQPYLWHQRQLQWHQREPARARAGMARRCLNFAKKLRLKLCKGRGKCKGVTPPYKAKVGLQLDSPEVKPAPRILLQSWRKLRFREPGQQVQEVGQRLE